MKCTATDKHNNSSSATFTVSVGDTTPPVLKLPSVVTAFATSKKGAKVNYTVTATDNVDPNPKVKCTPPSGAQFPLGKTTGHLHGDGRLRQLEPGDVHRQGDRQLERLPAADPDRRQRRVQAGARRSRRSSRSSSASDDICDLRRAPVSSRRSTPPGTSGPRSRPRAVPPGIREHLRDNGSRLPPATSTPDRWRSGAGSCASIWATASPHPHRSSRCAEREMAEGSSPLATASGAPTVREVDARPVEDGVLHLIVMGANLFSMHPLPESGSVSIGRDEDDDVRIDEPNASRHHARLHVGRGAGDRGHGQHQRHAPARQPAAAGAARAGAAGRGDLDRVGDADDPAAAADGARAPAADARLLRRAARGGVRQGVDDRARVRRDAAARRAGHVGRDGRRAGHAVGAARRRARVVRPRRVRADPVRARRQARRRLRRPHRRAARRAAASPRAPASPSSPPTRARPTG